MKKTALAILAIFLLAPMFSRDADAARIPWRTDRYSHVSRDENLPDLLRDFFAGQGIPVIVSERVAGTVSGNFENLAPGEFLDLLASSYGIICHYDGSVACVESAAEMRSEFLPLGNVSSEQLLSLLDRLGISDSRFPARAFPREGLLHVSGPGCYLSQVESALSLMQDRQGAAGRVSREKNVVKVFPLKYAWAQDMSFTSMDTQVTLPGVASLLAGIFSEQSAAQFAGGKRETVLPATSAKLKGKGMAATGGGTAAQPEDDEAGGPEGGESGASGEEPAPSSIQADARLNAVVVRDSEGKMPLYEEVVRHLDRPAGLVQIQAAIVDVTVDNLRDLGMNWTGKSGDSGSRSKGFGGFGADEDLAAGGPALSQGSGLVLSTLLGTSEEFFLARVNALEEQGKATLLSKPSILTLNNLEALLDNSRTFYVRVAGDREVDLFKVTAGTVLKVTPHIIEEDAKIMLTVKIEDGDISQVKVDDIPVVNNSSINTQAVVGVGESLLIGGYIRDTESDTVTKAPILGDIPVLGWLFKRKVKTVTRTERLFLITPKIVTAGSAPGKEFGQAWPLASPPAGEAAGAAPGPAGGP